jgi:nitrite reductase (NO-forming)
VSIPSIPGLVLDRRAVLRAAVATAGFGAIGAPVATRLFAQSGTPVASGSLPPNVSIVADQLANPRKLAIAADGTMYVTEAGAVGAEGVFATPDPGTPVPVAPVITRSRTGRVLAIAPDGTRTVIAADLPSSTNGEEVTGPAGISLVDGALLVVIGGPGPATGTVPAVDLENSLLRIDLASGEITQLANIAEYETAFNPDGFRIDSNCSDVVVVNTTAYISDSGGNTVYAVDLAASKLTPLAVIPGQPGSGTPNPLRGDRDEGDPVPTGLAALEDGTLLVGLFSDAPYTAGSAGIARITPDGTVAAWAGGLTTVSDVAIAPDGGIYASQLSDDVLAEPLLPGSIVRVRDDGSSELVLDGLSAPNGIAFDAAGDMYVVVNAVGTVGGGAILKITDPAGLANATTGTPVASPPPAPTEPPVAAAQEIVVMAHDLSFEPKEVRVPAGTEFTLTLQNLGVIPHDLTVASPSIATGIVAGGQTTSIAVTVPAGSYPFYCSVPGHRQAGMVGTLIAE